jgi:hypothetical protein
MEENAAPETARIDTYNGDTSLDLLADIVDDINLDIDESSRDEQVASGVPEQPADISSTGDSVNAERGQSDLPATREETSPDIYIPVSSYPDGHTWKVAHAHTHTHTHTLCATQGIVEKC